MRTGLATLVLTLGAVASSHADDGTLPNPLASVYFASGSSQLDDADRRALDAAAEWLSAHPGRLLRIEGHADARGDAAGNLRLSQQRTDRVRDYLVSIRIDPTRLVRAAFGEREAAADPAASRRVDIIGSLRAFGEEPSPEPSPERTPERTP